MPDFYKMFENPDVVSFDNYLATKFPDNEGVLYSYAFHLDLMHGIKKKNFWIMEELSGTLVLTSRSGVKDEHNWCIM